MVLGDVNQKELGVASMMVVQKELVEAVARVGQVESQVEEVKLPLTLNVHKLLSSLLTLLRKSLSAKLHLLSPRQVPDEREISRKVK